MMRAIVQPFAASLLISLLMIAFAPQLSLAKTAAEIDREAAQALKDLYDSSPAARELSKVAQGVLVFPSIVKGGLIVGGQYGEGALLRDGKKPEYYSSTAASYGLQAGLQKYGYALFFADKASLDYIERSDGWEIGVGPSVVIVDEGMAKNLSTTTVKEGIYAFIFSQKGLMAGIGIQGTKVTRINPR